MALTESTCWCRQTAANSPCGGDAAPASVGAEFAAETKLRRVHLDRRDVLRGSRCLRFLMTTHSEHLDCFPARECQSARKSQCPSVPSRSSRAIIQTRDGHTGPSYNLDTRWLFSSATLQNLLLPSPWHPQALVPARRGHDAVVPRHHLGQMLL